MHLAPAAFTSSSVKSESNSINNEQSVVVEPSSGPYRSHVGCVITPGPVYLHPSGQLDLSMELLVTAVPFPVHCDSPAAYGFKPLSQSVQPHTGRSKEGISKVPVHVGAGGLHEPSAEHVIVLAPDSKYPVKHEYNATLWYSDGWRDDVQ